MKPETLWQSAKISRFRALKSKTSRFDVVIIGGGITGLTAAYLLKKAGKKICLLERGRLGNVDTGLTTAHLTYVTDLRISQLTKTFGDQAAKAVWKAGQAAIDTIESIVRNEQIACNFQLVPGYLMASLDGKKTERKGLQQDADSARKLGFPARFATAPFFDRDSVHFPNQAKFHPLKYLSGLASAVDGNGCRIHEQSEVTEIKEKPQRVIANACEIEADSIVIATHVPLMGKTGLVSAAFFQSKIFPYSSYVIGAKIPRGLVPVACYWDTSDPYYYLRIEQGAKNDYVIFGGEDHKTGQVKDTQKCFERLQSRLLKLIPKAKPDRQWSGQVIETNDGLPYIGETAENQFAATGFSGNGMTFGTLAALMARDAIVGQDNPWKKLFAFDRTKVRGGTWNYLTENIDYPYYYLKDRLLGTEGKSTREVKGGEGKVIKLDGEHVACARDENGKLSMVSAVCTHLGCLVHWNSAEHTWDCPCHGSRFKPSGEVMAGPAETPLKPHTKSKPKSAKRA
jgi:glycine/D-amino acid oxidase-like deaminating enzyme/nitrite reductase/ring-hydroxylating ferredoxin subunit